MTRVWLACAAAVLAAGGLAACGDEGSKGDGGTFGSGGNGRVDGGAGGSAPTSRFVEEEITGCDQGGTQAVIATSGNTVALASLAVRSTTQTCMTMNGPGQVSVYGVCYAESTGGPFTAKTVTEQQYLAVTGVGLGLSPAGQATLAYTGGPPAALRCGASDLVIVQGNGGNFGAEQTIAAGSMSGGLVPSMAPQCLQNVCNSGDATGFWPAVAHDASGGLLLAFRDLHFGFAADDFQSSDVEFARGSNVLTIDVARGGGAFMHVASSPTGAVVAHYNGERDSSINGIYVHRETAPGTWEVQRAADAKIGEMFGFAVSPAGKMAIAYYDQATVRLRYVESGDGSSWSAPADIDTDGRIGQYPSLAYGPDGEPVVAYYRCGDYDPRSTSCDNNKDGLYLLRRRGAQWQRQKLRDEPGVFDGLYPALAFSNGKAVIGFQVRSYDASTMQNAVTWHAMREQ